jgi:hypothetical protein
MMSVYMFACISMAPKGQISKKFDIWDLLKNLSKKSKFVKNKANISSMLHEGLSIKLKGEEVQTFYEYNTLHYTYIAYLVCLWLI